MVGRVAKKTKEKPKFNYRDVDSVLHIKARPAFIRELMRQPEVVGASVVPPSSSAMIAPVNAREV